MILAQAFLHLELPHISSLKGRRQVLSSLKERLRKLNLSVIDLSGEYVREADLAIAWLAHDPRQSAQVRQSIEGILQRHFPELEYDLEWEEI